MDFLCVGAYVLCFGILKARISINIAKRGLGREWRDSVLCNLSWDIKLNPIELQLYLNLEFRCSCSFWLKAPAQRTSTNCS